MKQYLKSPKEQKSSTVVQSSILKSMEQYVYPIGQCRIAFPGGNPNGLKFTLNANISPTSEPDSEKDEKKEGPAQVN